MWAIYSGPGGKMDFQIIGTSDCKKYFISAGFPEIWYPVEYVEIL